jgi:anti-anti-sigma factor
LPPSTTLRDALTKHITDQITLIADLAGVRFMSVGGVEVLMQTGHTMNSRGGRLIVWRPHPRVERVMHLVGDHALEISYGTERFN